MEVKRNKKIDIQLNFDISNIDILNTMDISKY